MTTYLLVVNPKSGRGSGRSRAEALRTALGADADVEVFETRHRGHASEVVAERAREVERVVAIGGDGTLNEVLSGLMSTGEGPETLPSLGFLASGTANAATKAFGFAPDPAGAARALRDAAPRLVDVGVVTHAGGRRPFLLWFGAGYDAIVIDALNSTRTGPMGMLGLARGFPGVVRAVHRYPAPEITVRADDHRERKGASMVLANVAAMGLGSTATPAADPHDGLMDLLTVPRAGTLGLASLWMRMMVSSLAHAHGVEHVAVTRVRFEADGTVPFQLDGEPVGTLPADVRVEPGALRLLLA